jgi:predicted dehydrogenase
VRLGVIGLASSHVDQVLRLVRAGALGADVRVEALGVPGCEPVGADRVEALVAAGSAAPGPGVPGRATDGSSIAQAAASPRVLTGDPADLAAALADRVDAVLVTTRDARTHRALADPLLRAGIPLLVDKPFTADPEDAAHLVHLADRLGVPLTSSSALRWHPVTRAARTRWADEPGGIAVTATGPADPDDPHGGLATYAVHAVEAALAVLRAVPAAGDPVTVTRGSGARGSVARGVRGAGPGEQGAGEQGAGAWEDGPWSVTVRAGRDLATITVLAPRSEEQTPFHLAVAGATGRTDHPITLGPDYLLPVLRGFVAGVAAGHRDQVGPTGDALVATVRVTAALAR